MTHPNTKSSRFVTALAVVIGAASCAPPPMTVSATVEMQSATTTVAPTTTRLRVTTTTQDADSLFLERVNAHTRGGYPDQPLIDLGHEVCKSIDTLGAKLTFDTLARSVTESGFDARDMGRIAGAAVVVFCPENQAEMQRHLDSL